jgi:hypothetical protein
MDKTIFMDEINDIDVFGMMDAISFMGASNHHPCGGTSSTCTLTFMLSNSSLTCN